MGERQDDVREVYLQRVADFTKILVRQSRFTAVLSNLRFVVFFLGFGGSIYLFFAQEYRLSGIAFTSSLFLFFFLVAQHEKMKRRLEETRSLITVNEESMARLKGKWTDFSDTGEEFIDSEHPYSSDLDLFGRGSVFQWINVTNTFLGRLRLHSWLIAPTKNVAQIRERQEALRDLAEKLDWRQRLQVHGMLNRGGKLNPERMLSWAETSEKSPKKVGQYLAITSSLFTLGWMIWNLSISVDRLLIAILPMFLQLAWLYVSRKRRELVFKNFSKFKDTVSVYRELLQMIEGESFQSGYLQKLKVQLFDERGRLASARIRRLGLILDCIDIRFVPLFHFFFNGLFLWDYHCYQGLLEWKVTAGPVFRRWLEGIGEIEALASLAIIRHDEEDWAFPEVVRLENRSTEEQHFLAKGMGHPLLPRGHRVCNNLKMQGAGTILLITGSNMSGKSTLLRTVGVNLVLAYAGAPVCAAEMHCSLMNLYSSMRVNDNLEKSISSFYAELLRVKMIIEAAKGSEPMLFLLDELFRGTNSRDRHVGAKTVMCNLSRAGTIGLVSTHDLELASMEKESGLKIKNYHFEEHYAEERICFDYKLKPGVSTTSNAIYLMKMIGIDINDENR